MARNSLRTAHAIPVFTDAFVATIQSLKSAITRTRSVKHTGAKGKMRESPLADFFRGKLPSVYDVATGEVVDLENRSGPDLDVLVYDQTRNFPFVSDTSTVLPAEALLASVEVKSKLDSKEATRSIAAAARLRSLRPFKNQLGGRDIENPERSRKQARYYHTLFAYETSIGTRNWPHLEYQRITNDGGPEFHGIDLIHILGRGLINVSERKVVLENEETAHALSIFYFSILNFLDRESRRRGPNPYAAYAAKAGGKWEKISSS